MADCEGVTAGQLMVTYEHSDWRNGTLYLHLAPLPPPPLLPLTSCAGTFWCGHILLLFKPLTRALRESPLPQVDTVRLHAAALATEGRVQGAVPQGAGNGSR
jgi:hypothetical protein